MNRAHSTVKASWRVSLLSQEKSVFADLRLLDEDLTQCDADNASQRKQRFEWREPSYADQCHGEGYHGSNTGAQAHNRKSATDKRISLHTVLSVE